jgi:methylmalonyl-CoA mutase N-terminal domain/subunit
MTEARGQGPAPEERKRAFETLSGLPIERVYTPADLPGWQHAERLGSPGEYPFTRGLYPTMYRGRLWTMRMFAGFGRPEDTNRRFQFLLEQGQTGLSTAFDMPSLMGYDADHPRARGEVGREGVSVSTLVDMERLFDGIPLGRVTTSMTINCTASVILAMYLAVAERQRVPWTEVDGTIQNDMLKEFSAQKEWICPPAPAVRIVVDMVEFCMRSVPKFHPVSISGRRARRRSRSSPSRSPTASRTSRPASRADCPWTASGRSSRSSSTSTRTSLRRSRSSVRPDACGPQS